MTMKIAISLPDETVEYLRSLVAQGRAASVSAAVAAAVHRQQSEDVIEAIADEILAATGGPASDAEVRAARRELGLE